MTELRVALLGYGLSGKVFHAPVIESVPGLRLDAVMSRDRAKVHADWPAAAVTPNADEIFANPAIDLVVVATPNQTHFDLARRALEAGKHVVVDKPFTITVAEAAELTALAMRSGRLLPVYQSRRWDADFLTLRRIISDGLLGEVVHFESHYDRYRPTVQQRWKEQPVPGGGLWYDLGPHVVDQALVLFGEPEAVYADLGAQREGGEAVDYFHVLLRYGRLRAILHGANLVRESSRRFDVHGAKASYFKRGMDRQEDALRRGERPGAADFGVDPIEGVLTDETSRTIPNVPGDYAAFYRGVRDAIRGEGPNPVPPEEGLAVMRVIEAAIASAEERREIAYRARF